MEFVQLLPLPGQSFVLERAEDILPAGVVVLLNSGKRELLLLASASILIIIAFITTFHLSEGQE